MNGHKLCCINCSQDEQSSLSPILRHCLFTSSPMFGPSCLPCHGAAHKTAPYSLFCEELRLPRRLEYLKIITSPLPVQELVFLPGIFPAIALLCLLAILDYSITGVQATTPAGFVPWCLRAAEMAPRDSLRNPLAHEKKDVNLWGTSAIVPWMERELRGKNSFCETWGQSMLCQRSLNHRTMFQGKQTSPECLYPFFRTPSYWEKPAMKKKKCWYAYF